MRIPTLLLSLPLFAAPALAQGPTAATGSDWAVLATDGASTGFDAQPSGTSLGRGLGVRAAAGGFRAGARASSFATPWRTFLGFGRNAAAGVLISEHGTARNDQPTGTISAGTSADPPGTASPTQAPHDIDVTYALAQGTAATVHIAWSAHVSPGASASAAVDVDGDGVADWTSTPGTNERLTLPVTAGANGVTLAITTDGSASVAGMGAESYASSLAVTLSTQGGGSPLTYTWSNSGPACQGTLRGSETVFGPGVRLDFTITGGVPDGIGLLLIGTPAATPSPLPVGSCDLLLDNLALGAFFLTDNNGDAATRTLTRNTAMTVDFQAVTFGFVANAMGSTDLLNLVVQ